MASVRKKINVPKSDLMDASEGSSMSALSKELLTRFIEQGTLLRPTLKRDHRWHFVTDEDLLREAEQKAADLGLDLGDVMNYELSIAARVARIAKMTREARQ